MKAEHKQIRISHPAFEDPVEVDEGIALLLVALWDRGIMTCNSCQENLPGMIWIEFYSVQDAESFIALLVSGLDPIGSPEADDYLYSRIMGWAGNERSSWRYEVHTQDCREYYNTSIDAVELDTSKPCSIEFTVSMRFPLEDLTRVFELIRSSSGDSARGCGLEGRPDPADNGRIGCSDDLAGDGSHIGPAW